MNAFRVCVAAVAMCCLAGCDEGPQSGSGFTLPPGNAENGKAAFVKFRCYDCHSVSGVDLPAGEEPGQVTVNLGGEVARIKTYGELVTAIINPSHKLAAGYAASLVADPEGRSRMTNYNDVLTVTQLADLVEFLQSQYQLRSFETTDYPIYY